MGNYASCCRTSQDRGDDRPPPWLAQGEQSPIITDAINENFKQTVKQSNESEIEKFFHDSLLHGKPEDEEFELPYLHVADVEEEASDTRNRDEAFDDLLDSILDRCFLLCREEEVVMCRGGDASLITDARKQWQGWRIAGRVGRRGSLVVSSSRLSSLLRLPLLDRRKYSADLVLELDLQPDMYSIADGNILLAAPLSLHLVRVVYKLNDVVDMVRARDMGDESRERLRASGREVQQEELREESPAGQELQLVMDEYSWILDDFERKTFGKSGGVARKRFDAQSLSRPVRDFSAMRTSTQQTFPEVVRTKR
eukprot:233004-Hanusia_phi.AAC.1